MRRHRCVLTVLALSCLAHTRLHAQRPTGASRPAPRALEVGDLEKLPGRAPDRRVSYGADSSEYGELRLPSGAGPHPMVVLVHGGCFKAAYATARDLWALADSLAAHGIATWNVEYRRLGQPGAGWPGTYEDVGRAVDALRTLAPAHAIDTSRVVIVGHSAGGHLALWAASRHRLPVSSALFSPAPLRLRGVLDLAGPPDLAVDVAGYDRACREPVIVPLLGGTPASVPERFRDATPMSRLPLGVPQLLLWGSREAFVPESQARRYVRAVTKAGDQARLVVVPGANHFDIASPQSIAWPALLSAVRALLDGRVPQ